MTRIEFDVTRADLVGSSFIAFLIMSIAITMDFLGIGGGLQFDLWMYVVLIIFLIPISLVMFQTIAKITNDFIASGIWIAFPWIFTTIAPNQLIDVGVWFVMIGTLLWFLWESV